MLRSLCVFCVVVLSIIGLLLWDTGRHWRPAVLAQEAVPFTRSAPPAFDYSDLSALSGFVTVYQRGDRVRTFEIRGKPHLTGAAVWYRDAKTAVVISGEVMLVIGDN